MYLRKNVVRLASICLDFKSGIYFQIINKIFQAVVFMITSTENSHSTRREYGIIINNEYIPSNSFGRRFISFNMFASLVGSSYRRYSTDFSSLFSDDA